MGGEAMEGSLDIQFPKTLGRDNEVMEYVNIVFNDIFTNMYGNLEKPENLAALHQVLLGQVFPSIKTRPYHRTDYDVFQQCRLMIQYLHPFRVAFLDGQHRAAAVVCHSTGLSPTIGNFKMKRKWESVQNNMIPPLNFAKLARIASVTLHSANLDTWMAIKALRDTSKMIQEEAAAAVPRSLSDG
jgi:hypothetical protein